VMLTHAIPRRWGGLRDKLVVCGEAINQEEGWADASCPADCDRDGGGGRCCRDDLRAGRPSCPGAPCPRHHLELKVKGLHWSCHTKYLVGTFTVSGLKHGQFQVDATNTATSAVLLHNAKAKKMHATLKHTKLKYQFPKGEPGPSGTFNVYVVQGQRQPSRVVAVTINRCRT
jgi:hypothetical protein